MAQIVRVYAGDDGESHFETLTPDQMAEIVFPLGDGAVTFSQRPSPTFSDYHTAPRRQYVVNIAGIAEFETADGTKVRFTFPEGIQLPGRNAVVVFGGGDASGHAPFIGVGTIGKRKTGESGEKTCLIGQVLAEVLVGAKTEKGAIGGPVGHTLLRVMKTAVIRAV